MANSVDPDQAAPSGAVWSGSALFAYATWQEFLSIQEFCGRQCRTCWGQGSWDSINMYNIGQSHRVKVSAERGCRETLCKVWRLMRSQGLTQNLSVKSHWSAKYRSRSPGQGACWVRMLRRNTMQLLKILPTMVDEVTRVNEIVDGQTDAGTDRKPDAHVTPCQQVRQKS